MVSQSESRSFDPEKCWVMQCWNIVAGGVMSITCEEWCATFVGNLIKWWG